MTGHAGPVRNLVVLHCFSSFYEQDGRSIDFRVIAFGQRKTYAENVSKDDNDFLSFFQPSFRKFSQLRETNSSHLRFWKPVAISRGRTAG